jgi:hypothetical protein
MKDIRGKSVTDLAQTLLKKVDELGCDFTGAQDKQRNGMMPSSA